MDSDYFKPYNNLLAEARIFCAHDTAKDWFWYHTGRTISNVMQDTEAQAEELMWIEEHLWSTCYDLTSRLESFERYELCKQVTDQFDKLSSELTRMQVMLQKLR